MNPNGEIALGIVVLFVAIVLLSYAAKKNIWLFVQHLMTAARYRRSQRMESRDEETGDAASEATPSSEATTTAPAASTTTSMAVQTTATTGVP
jgi:hypothetical protein